MAWEACKGRYVAQGLRTLELASVKATEVDVATGSAGEGAAGPEVPLRRLWRPNSGWRRGGTNGEGCGWATKRPLSQCKPSRQN